MFKILLLLLGLGLGGFIVYKKLTAQPDDDWDDDVMYGSAQLHETADAAPAATA